MPDEPSDQPNNPQPLQPEEPAADSSESPVATPSVTPASPPARSGRKTKLIILIIVILVAVAAVIIGYRIHSNKQHTANAKKDIPYLTYGFTNSGDMTPTYPVDSANSDDTVFVDDQLFEGLVRAQDETKIAPALATSWSNPNNTTWVFNLRHGVKFHTGRTMTASDVKYSLDYAIANQGEQNDSTTLFLASQISQVSVVNPYQVKITTDGPDAVLLSQLTYLYIVDSKAKLGDPNAGTGPYSVKPGGTNPKATTLDLVASNDYWGGHVYTREVQFQEVPTTAQLATDTAEGKFDMAGDFSAQQLAAIKAKVPYFRPIAIPNLGIDYLELNLEEPSSPLHTLAARQAMAYALNIPAILKAAGATGTQVSQVIPQTLPGYDPSIKNVPYDPAKAKQLLATVPNSSTPITLKYSTIDTDQVAEIAKELDAAGFNIKLSGISDDTDFFSQVASGQGDLFFLGYVTNTLDGLDMINNTVAGTPNYTSPELTSLINQTTATIDPATRIALMQKMEQLVASDIPTIALYTQVPTYALTKPYVINSGLPDVNTSTYFYQVYQK